MCGLVQRAAGGGGAWEAAGGMATLRQPACHLAPHPSRAPARPAPTSVKSPKPIFWKEATTALAVPLVSTLVRWWLSATCGR